MPLPRGHPRPGHKTITSFDFGPIGGDVAGLPGLRSALSSELDLSNLTVPAAMDMSSVARGSRACAAPSPTPSSWTRRRVRRRRKVRGRGRRAAASCAGSSDDEASPCAADASRRFESPAPPASASASASPKGRFHRVASTSVIASDRAEIALVRLQRAPSESPRGAHGRAPPGAHYVGSTALSLEHIRHFNAERCVQYLLHDNDCRHYVNDLCAHLCPNAPEAFPRGVASKVSWQSAWQRVRGGRPHEALVVLPLQVFADVNNAPAVQRMKHAASASFAFGLGMRVVPYLAPTLGLRSGVAAALGTFTRAAPTRRLVTTAAGAFAGVSAETPVVREAIVLGGAAVGGAIDVTRAWPARAPASWRSRRTASGWGKRPGCRDRCGGGDLDARGVGRGDSRGRVRGEREKLASLSQRRRVARRRHRRRRRRSVAPRRRQPRSRGLSSRRRAPRVRGVVGEAPDGTKGRVRNVVGRVGRVGRAAVDGIKRFASPRGARRGWGAARARAAPRGGRRRGRASFRSRRRGRHRRVCPARCGSETRSVREGAAVRRAARLREGALRREPCRRQRRRRRSGDGRARRAFLSS